MTGIIKYLLDSSKMIHIIFYKLFENRCLSRSHELIKDRITLFWYDEIENSPICAVGGITMFKTLFGRKTNTEQPAINESMDLVKGEESELCIGNNGRKSRRNTEC